MTFRTIKMMNLADAMTLTTVQSCIKYIIMYERLWATLPPSNEYRCLNRLKYLLARCMQTNQRSELAIQNLIFTMLNEDLYLHQVLRAISKPSDLNVIPNWLQGLWKDVTTLEQVSHQHRNVLKNLMMELVWMVRDNIDYVLLYKELNTRLRYQKREENMNILDKLCDDIISLAY